MKDFNMDSYIKRCKKYLSFYYQYLLRMMIFFLIVGLIPVSVEWRKYLANGLVPVGVIWLILKFYVQYAVLICPYCKEPFSRNKWLADVPHRCKSCDRVIDPDAPDKFKV